MDEWFAVIAGSILAPLLTALVKKIPTVQETGGDKFGAVINSGICLALAVAAGAVLPRAYPELPRDLDTWMQLGLAAAAIGQTGNNVLSKTVLSAPAKTRRRERRRARKN